MHAYVQAPEQTDIKLELQYSLYKMKKIKKKFAIGWAINQESKWSFVRKSTLSHNPKVEYFSKY
jgi:hypothetical protein